MDFSKFSIDTPVELINEFTGNTLVASLGIKFTETGEGWVKAKMPVDGRTIRPGGLLHGGANLAMAETVAGLGSMLLVDMGQVDVRGIQVSANHTGYATSGEVYAHAKIAHLGNQTHVWDVEIRNEDEKLISISRVTNMIVPRDDK